MFILYGLLLGLGIGLLTRGRLTGLAALQFRWAQLALIGFAGQMVLFSDAVTERVGDLGPPLYVGSTLLVLVSVLRNIRIPGMVLVALGAASNFAAIGANGGYMPTTADALAQLGRDGATVYSNSVVMQAALLWPLTDIFAMPRWLPLANVYSIGDVLIGLGIAVTVVIAMRGGGRDVVLPAGSATATAMARDTTVPAVERGRP